MEDLEQTKFLFSLATLLFFSLTVGSTFSILGLPRVIGEICAGIILGPSMLGIFSPDLFAWLFSGSAGQEQLLSVFYWLGMIFLMFTAGFNMATEPIQKARKLIVLLSIGSLGLPFFCGFFVQPWADFIAGVSI